MVTVGGANYVIGFAVGCFTTNFREAQPQGLWPGCGTRGDTTYATPDLYDNNSGILVYQPWWGDRTEALAFATAYRDAYQNASQSTPGGVDACDYAPNLDGGLQCADSPYFAYAPADSDPYYKGYMFFGFENPGTD